MEKPTKENTLYLPIKQVYFDAIVAGDKKEEYREIKDTTARKYLMMEKGGSVIYVTGAISEDDPDFGDPYVYNGGTYPYAPRDFRYLSLAVGYAKERDTALVEVESITFQVQEDKNGVPVIFDFDEEEKVQRNPDGKYALWVIVYHLGKIVELHRKGE